MFHIIVSYRVGKGAKVLDILSPHGVVWMYDMGLRHKSKELRGCDGNEMYENSITCEEG